MFFCTSPAAIHIASLIFPSLLTFSENFQIYWGQPYFFSLLIFFFSPLPFILFNIATYYLELYETIGDQNLSSRSQFVVSVCRRQQCLNLAAYLIKQEKKRGRSHTSCCFCSTVCGLAHHNTIMKVNRKKLGPGVIPGIWQSWRIGSTPPKKTAVKSKLNLISAISLAFLCFPVWTWKVIGAKTVTVDGSAARREYLFTVNRGDACSGCGFTQDVLSPTPSFWSFLKKEKKAFLIVRGHRLCLGKCCATCLHLESSLNVPS